MPSRSQQTAQAPRPSASRSSDLEIEFLTGGVAFIDYQKGDVVQNIEDAAKALGMSGKVTAVALRYVRTDRVGHLI
jgi:hypothetical protein